MSRRWIYDPKTKEMVPAEEFQREPLPFVMGDIGAYQSQKTGEMIKGRAAHREHLKRHGLVEIGDAWDKGVPKAPERSRLEEIKRTLGPIVTEKLRYK